MLITHVKPTDLWGSKVYDVSGEFIGEVVAIGSRRGVVRKVAVQRRRNELLRIVLPTDTRVEENIVTLPRLPIGHPGLRLVR